MIDIIQGSVVTQIVLGGQTIYPPVTKQISYCQKLLKFANSRQTYCNEVFFGPTCITIHFGNFVLENIPNHKYSN